MEETPLILVSVLDDAIDEDATALSEIVKYFKSRDAKLLKYKPGRKPQLYHTREVKQSLWESVVMSADTEAERYRRAFQCGVFRVENVLQRDGSILPEWKPTEKETERGVMLDENAERFSANDRHEIGSAIFQRSFLAPRTVRAYQLPLTCQHALAQREFRLADATPPSPAPSSSAASSDVTPARSAETTTAPSSNGDASDSRTPATAVAPFQEAAANPQ